jgi:outer membrane receptor protein involved in Fe transport
LNARIEIANDLYLFGIPSWSYKTKIFFEDANTAELKQNGCGILGFNAGIGYKNFELSLFGNNLLAEKYIISAGNTGSLFGDPTQIPGPPRMFGTKLSWKF